MPRRLTTLTRFGVLVGVPLCILTAGCTSGHVHVRPVKLPTPLVSPLPLTVGVYYSPEFRKYEQTVSVTEGFERIETVVLGPANVAVFDQIFSAAFAKVVSLERRNVGPTDAVQPDGVIEPLVREVSYSSMAGFTIAYDVALYARSGQSIASWRVAGSGRAGEAALLSAARPGEAALRAAAAALLVQIYESPQLKQWLETGEHSRESNVSPVLAPRERQR